MSTDTTTTTDSTVEIIEQGIVTPVVEDRAAVNEKAVNEITDMTCEKFEDEGTRNFAIGGKFIAHSKWQKGNFPAYTGGDFDSLAGRIRDLVRMRVAIKADSIRIAEWAKAYVLRELVREHAGAVADQLSCFECMAITGKALAFDKKAVEGVLVEGWLDTIVAIGTERMSGNRVTSEEFSSRIESNAKRLKALDVAANPALAAAVKAAADLTTKADDTRKAKNSITKDVADALAKGHIDPAGVLGIVEHVAKELKQPMPTAFGFDPATCTVSDCDLLASTMWKSGKIVEMRHLLAALGKMVSAADKALAAQEAKIDHAAAGIEPAKSKIAREQQKAERKLAKVA